MITAVLVVLGLAFGSFVNALCWRLRQQSLVSSRKSSAGKKKLVTSDQRQATQNRMSILTGRSMCVHCNHELAWYDLIPVLSWVMLRGRCRYCHKPISWQYPLVELGAAALFVWSYMAWPYGFDGSGTTLFAFWLVFLVGFVALAVYDLKWMELPNKVVYPLIGLAFMQVVTEAFVRGSDPLIEAVWGFLAIGGLFYVLFQVSGGKWIGGGDVKLGFMIGLLVGGPLGAIMVIFIASVFGTIVALPGLARESLKATSRIPFGPFLLLATVVVYLYGESIVDWYANNLP